MEYLAKNLRDWMARNDAGEVDAARAIGVHQSTINRLIKPNSSKPIQNPSRTVLAKVAAALGCSIDDVLHRDLAGAPHEQEASHSGRLDMRRLGVALTAIDKALHDVEIQGRLGKLDDALQFAYMETFDLTDPDDPLQRKMLDKLVAERLRGWDEGTREDGSIEPGARKNRAVATARKEARGR